MKKFPDLHNSNIAIIGLGYVGLPLAIEFSKAYKKYDSNSRIIGYDINQERIDELISCHDKNNEISENELSLCDNLIFTYNAKILLKADIFIVTVPTPIDQAKSPNLRPLIEASKLIGSTIKSTSTSRSNISPIIIYESTVYPGTTEEVCVLEIEAISELKSNEDFYYGYSPERVNPGDPDHRLSEIKKITSGSTLEASKKIDDLYKIIIKAGTYPSPSIKIAESAKVIENIQRDINIALVNELSIIFNKLGIDTLDVLKAAQTKWNFLAFKPGLVGGHCIGVDPYYLTHKAQTVGYNPDIVLSGRRINDSMGNWIVNRCVLEMVKVGQPINGAKVLILGITFKENCPDIRNTKVIEMIHDLEMFKMNVCIYDPIANPKELKECYDLTMISDIKSSSYNLIICAVPHNEFCEYSYEDWSNLTNDSSIIFDLKGIVPRKIKNLIRI